MLCAQGPRHTDIIMSNVIDHYYKSSKHKQTIINLLALPGRITYTFRNSRGDTVQTELSRRLLQDWYLLSNISKIQTDNAPHLHSIRIDVGYWQDTAQELEVLSFNYPYSLKTKSSQCHYVVMTRSETKFQAPLNRRYQDVFGEKWTSYHKNYVNRSCEAWITFSDISLN